MGLKNITFILFILINLKALAYDAVITVLEAPLFRKQNQNEKVIQYLRRGDILQIASGQNFSNKYLKTFDHAGREAWVLREHIFIYFEDQREKDQRQIDQDPTDYRNENPLLEDFTYSEKLSPSHWQLNLLLGNYSQGNYDLENQMIEDQVSLSYGIEGAWFKHLNTFTKTQFLGVKLKMIMGSRSLQFQNENSNENHYRIGLGASWGMELWRSEKSGIDFYLGILFYPLYHMGIQAYDETKNFTGNAWEIELRLPYRFKKIFGNWDLSIAPGFSFTSVSKLKSKSLLPNPWPASSYQPNTGGEIFFAIGLNYWIY